MLPSGLSEHVYDQEDLARFLTHSSQFNAMMVKPAALMPNPRDRETSVSRHGAEPTDELWQLGLFAAGNRTLYGAAIFKTEVVRRAGLDVLSFEPPPRHAAIRGWPWQEDDPMERKAERKALAVEIAGAAGRPVIR
jgi:hypothetical protein